MSIVSPWKQDFPIFSSHAHPNLCYLDTAATCLTPKHVAEAIFHYHCFSHANSHKGLYKLSASVTEKVEYARGKVAEFLGAQSSDNIVFNSGTTEALNLIAYSFLEPILIEAQLRHESANIVISAAEHHANLLPWQRLSQQYNAELRIIPLANDGTIDFTKIPTLLDKNTCLLAFSHCSNVIGKFNAVDKICRMARSKNIPTVVDGAQAISRGGVNVTTLDCDFYVFSGHKVYGPTGCGVLYAKLEHYERMRPFQLGGGMIDVVDFKQSQFINGPLKFEPGSHNVSSIVGLVEAIDYLNDITWSEINNYLDNLAMYLHKSLSELPYYQPLIKRLKSNVLVQKNEKYPSLLSFQLANVHCHDVASLLDNDNVAVRAGHHCAQPLHKMLGVNSTIRASLGIYNDFNDIDKLVAGLDHAHHLMAI